MSFFCVKIVFICIYYININDFLSLIAKYNKTIWPYTLYESIETT